LDNTECSDFIKILIFEIDQKMIETIFVQMESLNPIVDATVCFIGPFGVGKTSLLLKMKDSTYDILTIQSTICPQNFTFQLKDLTFRFIDTAGQERYRSLTQSYSRGSDIGLICYFPGDDPEKVKEFVDILDRNEVTKRILVLTKSDVKKCSDEKINELQEKWGCFDHVQTSDLTLEGIEELKNLLISVIKQDKTETIRVPSITLNVNENRINPCC
jgi:small GTP-binding protein